MILYDYFYLCDDVDDPEPNLGRVLANWTAFLKK